MCLRNSRAQADEGRVCSSIFHIPKKGDQMIIDFFCRIRKALIPIWYQVGISYSTKNDLSLNTERVKYCLLMSVVLLVLQGAYVQ